MESENMQAWRKIFPESEHLKTALPQTLRCFNYFKPEQTKCIIIGQDPYPAGADGLAFSCQKIRVSAKKIFTCLLKRNLIDKIPETGNLEIWAERGVLLLNSMLTYGSPAHTFWKPVVAQILRNLSKIVDVPVFIWGSETKN